MNEYRIESNIFWKNLSGIYDHTLDWHLSDSHIQKITEKNLGLRYINTTYGEKTWDVSSYFIFKIANKERLLWAKIKYGI